MFEGTLLQQMEARPVVGSSTKPEKVPKRLLTQTLENFLWAPPLETGTHVSRRGGCGEAPAAWVDGAEGDGLWVSRPGLAMLVDDGEGSLGEAAPDPLTVGPCEWVFECLCDEKTGDGVTPGLEPRLTLGVEVVLGDVPFEIEGVGEVQVSVGKGRGVQSPVYVITGTPVAGV